MSDPQRLIDTTAERLAHSEYFPGLEENSVTTNVMVSQMLREISPTSAALDPERPQLFLRSNGVVAVNHSVMSFTMNRGEGLVGIPWTLSHEGLAKYHEKGLVALLGISHGVVSSEIQREQSVAGMVRSDYPDTLSSYALRRVSEKPLFLMESFTELDEERTDAIASAAEKLSAAEFVLIEYTRAQVTVQRF